MSTVWPVLLVVDPPVFDEDVGSRKPRRNIRDSALVDCDNGCGANHARSALEQRAVDLLRPLHGRDAVGEEHREATRPTTRRWAARASA